MSYHHQNRILDAVDRWQSGYWMLRETGIGVSGRIDALLVPVDPEAHCMKELRCSFFERPRIVGVEVKGTRADFLKGLKSGQYERYDETLSGVYVATYRGIAKTKELPDRCGHLIIDPTRKRDLPHRLRFTDTNPLRCACKRHPTYTDEPVEAYMAWSMLFKMHDQYLAEAQAAENKLHKIKDKIGRVVERKVMGVLDQAIGEVSS